MSARPKRPRIWVVEGNEIEAKWWIESLGHWMEVTVVSKLGIAMSSFANDAACTAIALSGRESDDPMNWRTVTEEIARVSIRKRWFLLFLSEDDPFFVRVANLLGHRHLSGVDVVLADKRQLPEEVWRRFGGPVRRP